MINPQYPVFVLAFCILPSKAYIEQITPAVRSLKFDLFGHDLVILHEHDIRKKTGPFAQLNKRRRDVLLDVLLDRLTDIIVAAPMTLVAVVIDKVRHKARYVAPDHPYHLALKYGLERVQTFLAEAGQGNRTTTVVCEARGAKEDRDIELAFRRVSGGGNRSGGPIGFPSSSRTRRAMPKACSWLARSPLRTADYALGGKINLVETPARVPDVLDAGQKANKVKNLLQGLRRAGVVHTRGPPSSATWHLAALDEHGQ